MNKLVNATKGEPCNCPDEKYCTACYAKKLKPRITVQQSRKGSIPIKVEHINEKNGGNSKIRSLISIGTWNKDRRESKELKLQEEKEKEQKAYLKQLEQLKKAQKQFQKEIEEEEERKLWEQRKLTLERLEKAKKERYERLKQEREKEVLEQLKEQQKYRLMSYTPQLRVETDNTFYSNGKYKKNTKDIQKVLVNK